MTATSSTLKDMLDEISRTLPHRMHPDSKAIEAQAVAWYDQASLVEDCEKGERTLRSANYGLGTSAAFPTLSTAAVMFWARFSLLYMAFDDFCAEQHAAANLPGYLRRAGNLWLKTNLWPDQIELPT
jgi:hypothetical protein